MKCYESRFYFHSFGKHTDYECWWVYCFIANLPVHYTRSFDALNVFPCYSSVVPSFPGSPHGRGRETRNMRAFLGKIHGHQIHKIWTSKLTCRWAQSSIKTEKPKFWQMDQTPRAAVCNRLFLVSPRRICRKVASFVKVHLAAATDFRPVQEEVIKFSLSSHMTWAFPESRATPSHHPFYSWIFPYKTSTYLDSPIYGNPHIDTMRWGFFHEILARDWG